MIVKYWKDKHQVRRCFWNDAWEYLYFTHSDLKEFSQPIGDKSIVMMESPAHQIVPPFWYAIPGVGKSKTFPAWCVLRLIRKVIPKDTWEKKEKGLTVRGKGVVQVEKNKKKQQQNQGNLYPHVSLSDRT